MLRTIFATALACLVIGAGVQARADGPVTVHVSSGDIVGRETGAIAVFKGVPFAAPPVGPWRWRPPQPVAAWTSPRDASAYGPACPQAILPGGMPNGGGYNGPVSEDCLNLNVFAPKGAHKAPVMVWIFGGGNVAGANSIAPNDGSAFARDGVVLVSVNYRLGALGFFAHPALTKAAPKGEPIGSYGIMDQIAALKWVRRNIAGFGGDPDNVTIFGESAGGEDVLILMTAPAARGLFAKATVQSGGGWDDPPELTVGEAQALSLGANAGLPHNPTAEQLRALPADKVIVEPGRFGPMRDGKLVISSPIGVFSGGDQAHVPLIIGSNSDEASLLPPSRYAAFLASQPDAVKAAYPEDADDPNKLARDIFTDSVMGAPARMIARLQAKTAPVWLYEFSYVREVRRGKIPGANHTSENPYVFDTQMIIPNYADQIRDEDREEAAKMHSCWVSFAKTGTPTCSDGPNWPAYTQAGDQLMEFGLTNGVRQHFRKAQLDAVEAHRAADWQIILK